MGDRNLLRSQYSKQRKTIVENFKKSQTLIPVVEGDLNIPNYRGVYSKGFVGHTGPNGIVVGPNPVLYAKFIEAIRTRNQTLLNEVYSTSSKLVDAHCLFDVELEGRYKSSFVIPPAPSITSLTAAAEILEVYVMALVRNYNFHILDPECIFYDDIPQDAKNYLNTLIGYLNRDGIKGNFRYQLVDSNGNITINTLFRGISRGDTIGPYVSQFFYYETAIGNLKLEQKYQCLDLSENIIPDISNSKYYFGKTEQYFNEIWNGGIKSSALQTKTKYMTTILDLAMYINRDQIWEAIFVTASLFLSRGVDIGFHTSSRNPGFARFVNLGPVDLYNLLTKATKLAMNSTWVWKWSQLRPRPEEMAYQIHLAKKYASSDLSGSVINFPSALLNNPILEEIATRNNGKYLMPLGYSQGSPFHPSYPGGHATIAGAMVTIMKAWFNCDWLIPAVVPDLTGENLVMYKLKNDDKVQYLRIEDELDKIVTNCSHSRNMAGIHYQSDTEVGILIGEQAAISVLQDEVNKYSDNIAFRFRRRSGEVVTLSNHKNPIVSPLYPTKVFDGINNEIEINYKTNYVTQGQTEIYSTQVKVMKLPNGQSPNPTANALSVFSNNYTGFNEFIF
jgi:membrane-associated phospholipid phosphatase